MVAYKSSQFDEVNACMIWWLWQAVVSIYLQKLSFPLQPPWLERTMDNTINDLKQIPYWPKPRVKLFSYNSPYQSYCVSLIEKIHFSKIKSRYQQLQPRYVSNGPFLYMHVQILGLKVVTLQSLPSPLLLLLQKGNLNK